MRDLLETTSARAPVFHCFGLHEWAMLYRPASAEDRGVDARSVHQTLPLRVSQEEVKIAQGGGGFILAWFVFGVFVSSRHVFHASI